MLLSNIHKPHINISAIGIFVHSQNAEKPSNNTPVPVKSNFCNHFHFIFLKVHGIHQDIMSQSQRLFQNHTR